MNMQMRIDSFGETTCSGCMACESKCPAKAIFPAQTEQGFIVPKIDDSLCISCGLCVKVCDFKKVVDTQEKGLSDTKAFSLVIKDRQTLKNSTSGGAFSAFSNEVLSRGGFVAGPVWGEGFSLSHQITDDVYTRDRMRGSKYVQSNTSGIFSAIEEYLNQGKLVLFTGTPCQCAGLKSYLDKDYDNLLVMDFLCHGVPNNKLFKEHIAFLENRYKKDIVEYSFRDKTYGWDSYNNKVVLSNGRTKFKWLNQVYYSFFVSNVSLRPSCYACKYRTEKRFSDITVADFWGIERITGKRDNAGASLVFTHTEKGTSLLSNCSESVYCNPVAYDKVSYRLASNPVKSKLDRETFWNTYQSGGYLALVKKYFKNSVFKQLRFEVRKFTKKIGLG